MGSFINVIAFRYPHWPSGRSFCPACQTKLQWFELIPLISFIALKGKCRHCHKKISLQYPLVELASGLALFLPLYFKDIVIGIIWSMAALILILISAIDWRLQIIPDKFNISLAVLGIIKLSIYTARSYSLNQASFIKHYAGLFPTAESLAVNYILAVLAAFLFLGSIIAITRGKAMGVGDLKLGGALGLLVGWPDIIFVLMTAFIVGAVWGVGLIIGQRKTLKAALPFAPFLTAGVFINMFWGLNLLKLYFSLFP